MMIIIILMKMECKIKNKYHKYIEKYTWFVYNGNKFWYGNKFINKQKITNGERGKDGQFDVK